MQWGGEDFPPPPACGYRVIYVIHLDGAMVMDDHRSARHYIGFVNDEIANALPDRMRQHRLGRGSRFLAAANQRGIVWHLVAVYRGTRVDERKLKDAHHSERYCPICRRDLAVNPRAGAVSRRAQLGLPEALPIGAMNVAARDLADSLRRLRLSHLHDKLREYE